MSAATSPATGRRYGLVRVCRLWAFPRSSFYAQRRAREFAARTWIETAANAPARGEFHGALLPLFPSDQAPVGDVPSLRRPHEVPAAASQRSATEAEAVARSHAQAPQAPSLASTAEADVVRSEHGGTLPARDGAASAPTPGPRVEVPQLAARVPRRGPAPRHSDEQVLELVREDLALSPFQGEGHRKVAARLRRAGYRVHRRQVLRVMRTARLLSPHRAPQGKARAHDGTIVTEGPEQMWGTDGLRVETVAEGWVWIFVAVEHWNGEVVGVHISKRGDRFAALEPLRQGLQKHRGGVSRGIGQGLRIRLDHGTQYTSEHFQQEAKYLGLELSYGYVAEPETNGVSERFHRTLKEQVLHGQVYRDVEELRAAVAAFVERYNEHWLLEKNGFRSPNELRAARLAIAA